MTLQKKMERPFLCPNCQGPLLKKASKEGLLFECASCLGRGMGPSVLRKLEAGRAVSLLWKNAHASLEQKRPCPFCFALMKEVEAVQLKLDICVGCQMVWFDPKEFQKFIDDVEPPQPINAKASELVNLTISELMRAEQEQVAQKSQAQNIWLFALVLLHPFILYWLNPLGRATLDHQRALPSVLLSLGICVPAILGIKFGISLRVGGGGWWRILIGAPIISESEIPGTFIKAMAWLSLLFVPALGLLKLFTQ